MLRTGVAFVPSSSRTFSIEEIPFLYLDHISGPREVQTAFGAETEGPELGMFGYNPFTGERQELGRFTMPGGDRISLRTRTDHSGWIRGGGGYRVYCRLCAAGQAGKVEGGTE